MKKVSVIVSAYNAHDCLARCLGSLVNQTLEDIEIIVINDASQDDTWEIMQRCEKQFPDKVKIINGERNRGGGGAKNQGLDVASGEYIGFVDCDDYVAPNMFELLYNKAREMNADIVDCGIYLEATDAALLTTGDNVAGVLDDEKRRILVLSGGYLTTKVFRNRLFNEPRIRMRENIFSLVDNDIVKYMILKADNIYNVKEVLYRYCDSQGSATKDRKLETYYQSMYSVVGGIYDICHELPAYNRILDAMEYTMVNWYSCGVNRCLYDQIVKYGADKSCIHKYFDNVGEKERQMLSDFAAEKARVVTIPYRENKEVMKRIDELDIAIMEECDRRYT